jgi:hypothetical protein
VAVDHHQQQVVANAVAALLGALEQALDLTLVQKAPRSCELVVASGHM